MAGIAVLIIQVAMRGNAHPIALRRRLLIFQMAHIRFETKKQSALPSPESINPRPVDRMLHPNDSIEEIAPNMLPDAGRNKTEIQCLSSTVCALHL
jgi:hypothetical protein